MYIVHNFVTKFAGNFSKKRRWRLFFRRELFQLNVKNILPCIPGGGGVKAAIRYTYAYFADFDKILTHPPPMLQISKLLCEYEYVNLKILPKIDPLNR